MPAFAQLLSVAALAVAAAASAIHPIAARAAAAGHTCPDATVAMEAAVDAGGGRMVTLTSFQCSTAAAAAPVARRGLLDSPPLCYLLGTCHKPTPKPTYSPHKPTYSPHKPTYSPHKPTYSPPKPTYKPPHSSSPTYAPPPPSSTYTPPPPSDTYTPPASSTYTAPAPSDTPAPPKNVCGGTTACACTADAGRLPPIADDCATIEDAIAIFAAQLSTFVVAADHLETLTFGTCSYFFRNMGTADVEYCWTDLSVTGSTAGSTCFPPVQPIHSEGLCTSSDGSWAVGAAHS